jgi:hypothetical protein
VPEALPAPTHWNSASFPHDARATLADRRKHLQHGRADLQEHLSAMPYDLARRLKQPPAHGLHLYVLPSALVQIAEGGAYSRQISPAMELTQHVEH